ncbi:MAG: autotransporter-associated beta strand repeat-containing protein, partial [bacterium]
YWDGGTGGVPNNGDIDGGPGIWNSTNINWNIRDASLIGAWPQYDSTAFFQGPAGGLVDVIGTQSIGGLHFRTDGYILRGGTLRLWYNGFGNNIEIDAGVTATIESILSDDGINRGITKSGAGTLILAGNNTYGGGTLLQEGILGVGHNNALGTGALIMEADTTLRAVVNNLTLANAITLNGAGAIDTQAYTLTLSSTLSGASGELGKIGSGTLILGNTTTLSAVDVQTGTLDNRGTLSAAASMSLSGDNTTLLNAVGSSVTVQGGAGTLLGGAGAQRIDNAGSISGAINLGAGSDSYILRTSGTQRGNVNAEGGIDQLQIETAANATRSLGAGAFANFETIELNKDATST